MIRAYRNFIFGMPFMVEGPNCYSDPGEHNYSDSGQGHNGHFFYQQNIRPDYHSYQSNPQQSFTDPIRLGSADSPADQRTGDCQDYGDHDDNRGPHRVVAF